MPTKNAVKKAIKILVVIPCTVFSRVVGYYAGVQFWNKGKRQEFKERETYKTDGSRWADDTE